MDANQDVANGLVNRILLGVSAGLSILGCILTIATYAFYKEIRTVSRHIVICITIADFVVVSSNCFALLAIEPASKEGVPEFDSVGCTMQSFVGTTAVLWSFLWTMILAIYLHLGLVKGNKATGKRLVWPWAHLFCWIIPLIINVAALCLNKLGNAGDRNTAGWCWINIYSDYNDAKFWMLLDGKAIELLTYIVILLVYLRMKMLLRRKIPKEAEQTHLLERHSLDAARNTDKKILLIPISFIMLRIWGTIRFFLLMKSDALTFSHDISTFETALLFLQTIGDNLQGAVNCVLFCCMTPVVRKRINQSLSSLRRERFHLYDAIDSTQEAHNSDS